MKVKAEIIEACGRLIKSIDGWRKKHQENPVNFFLNFTTFGAVEMNPGPPMTDQDLERIMSIGRVGAEMAAQLKAWRDTVDDKNGGGTAYNHQPSEAVAFLRCLFENGETVASQRFQKLPLEAVKLPNGRGRKAKDRSPLRKWIDGTTFHGFEKEEGVRNLAMGLRERAKKGRNREIQSVSASAIETILKGAHFTWSYSRNTYSVMIVLSDLSE